MADINIPHFQFLHILLSTQAQHELQPSAQPTDFRLIQDPCPKEPEDISTELQNATTSKEKLNSKSFSQSQLNQRTLEVRRIR